MQTALDFGPQARRTDPATSHAAAAAVSRQMRERHHDVIVAALREHGPMGKDGISTRCRLTGVMVARRLPELVKLGSVRLTGKTVASTTGRAEREYEAT
jgi:predicted ArsR family transcriptional regulator